MAAIGESAKTQYLKFWKWIQQKILHMDMYWTLREMSWMRSLKLLNKNNSKMEMNYNFHKIKLLIMENK